ncbi:hypothetical protein T10_429 [Trichinella papuae]|uniref:Uncharacterized protein n=1 Tax=Trichinella papuae TaxID=268474 RepID=A0A0V1M4W1_9BILA|nr:hypothetical protein T10_429 [Trichinella papuae]
MIFSYARVTADSVSTSLLHRTPPTELSTVRRYDYDGEGSVSTAYLSRALITGRRMTVSADVVCSSACSHKFYCFSSLADVAAAEALSSLPQGCHSSAAPSAAAPVPQGLLPLLCAWLPRAFLVQRLRLLRKAICPASQDGGFDGGRRESCFELVMQDLVGCSIHPKKRLQEQPEQMSSIPSDDLILSLLLPEKFCTLNASNIAIIVVRVLDLHGPPNGPHLRVCVRLFRLRTCQGRPSLRRSTDGSEVQLHMLKSHLHIGHLRKYMRQPNPFWTIDPAALTICNAVGRSANPHHYNNAGTIPRSPSHIVTCPLCPRGLLQLIASGVVALAVPGRSGQDTPGDEPVPP